MVIVGLLAVWSDSCLIDWFIDEPLMDSTSWLIDWLVDIFIVAFRFTDFDHFYFLFFNYFLIFLHFWFFIRSFIQSWWAQFRLVESGIGWLIADLVYILVVWQYAVLFDWLINRLLVWLVDCQSDNCWLRWLVITVHSWQWLIPLKKKKKDTGGYLMDKLSNQPTKRPLLQSIILLITSTQLLRLNLKTIILARGDVDAFT